MDEKMAMEVGRQLRKPEGEIGREVGRRMNVSNRNINLFAIDALDAQPQDRILEIGMGNGYFVKDILCDPSIGYTGCDYSEVMIEEATSINKELVEAGRARFEFGRATELPFPDASFTKVLTVNTIYFWDEPAQVLAEIRRVLVPGGVLCVALRPKLQVAALPFAREGFTGYTAEAAQNLLQAHGFMQVQLLTQDEPPQEIEGTAYPVHALVLLAKRL